MGMLTTGAERYRLRGGGALAALMAVLLSGCTVLPKQLDPGERDRLAAESRRHLFEGQAPIDGPLTLPQAMARALKYHAEHRQRQMEEAAAAAQLDVAQFDLLPKITANAGYTTRDNESFGFGFTPGGTIAATPSASVERSRVTSSLGVSWNLLDFGVSYYRAKQLADQTLIAEERRRKAVQTLMHDVRIAWWRAEAAQRLIPAADRLLEEVDKAIDRTRLIEARKLLPPVQTATLRRALLDLSQQIAFRRQDLAQSKVELAALVNAPPGAELRIAGPASNARDVRDLTANVDKLEGLALRMRPEMAEEGYRARITEAEARKALLGLLPGLSFDIGRNYDSNRFLVNNAWTSAGVNIAFNLVKAFSLPALRRSEEAQRAADSARRQAMAMAILVQTRLAAIRYALVSDEFLVWEEAARDDDLIVEYISSSEKVGIDNELELIRSRARAMASHINRDLAYANVQASIARLYHSVGYDPVPREDEARPLSDLAQLVQTRFAELERTSFSPRPGTQVPLLAFGEFKGADARMGGLLREGARRVLGSAKLKVVDGPADVRLDMQLAIEAPKDGRRPARVTISAVPRSGVGGLTREFKSTLSEPLDDEQLRVMGEGVAYRIVGEFSSVRITRPALRVAQTLEFPALREPRQPAGENNAVPPGRESPLVLRPANDLASMDPNAANIGNP